MLPAILGGTILYLDIPARTSMYGRSQGKTASGCFPYPAHPLFHRFFAKTALVKRISGSCEQVAGRRLLLQSGHGLSCYVAGKSTLAANFNEFSLKCPLIHLNYDNT